MRMDMPQTSGARRLVDQPGDGVPVQRTTVLPGQQQRVVGVNVRLAVVLDQSDQMRGSGR